MTGSGDARVSATATEWRTESRFYRRPPGWPWLLGLLLIPLLLGWIAWGALGLGKPKVSVSLPSVSVTAPSVSVPSLNLAPLSLLRNGNDFTLTGELPDDAAKASLLAATKAALGPGVNVIDNLSVKAGVSAPDFSGLGGLLKAAGDIPDFGFKVEGGTVTLTGTAPSEDVKAAVEAAAKAAWPNVTIVNNIEVKAATGGACDSLQADITGLLKTPITFETDGFTLTQGAQQELTAVADKVKACANAKLGIVGHTDNTGNDAINNPLSANRAKSVGDYLVSQGVPAGEISTSGVGSSQPVAGNDTDAGRAQNRRVDITVS